jgi:catalase
MVCDGFDADRLTELRGQVEALGSTVEVIAPVVGGVRDSTGAVVVADQKVGGAPSVLYDAVALILCEDDVPRFAGDPAVRDFVADAFAHCKIIGFVPAAMPVLAAAGIADRLDAGVVDLDDLGVDGFLDACRPLRLWARELGAVSVG